MATTEHESEKADGVQSEPNLAEGERSRNDLGREAQPEDAAAVARAGEQVERTERRTRQSGDAAAITSSARVSGRGPHADERTSP